MAYSTLTRRYRFFNQNYPGGVGEIGDAGDGKHLPAKRRNSFSRGSQHEAGCGWRRDYIIAIIRDLTERKLAEARLQASQDRYREVFDRSPVGICWVETKTGRLLMVNPKYCEILGRTEQDLLSRNFQSITHPDDLAVNLDKLRRLAEGKFRHFEMEKRYLRPDGSVRWAEIEVAAMWPEAGTPVWHMAIVQDTTERKQARKDFGNTSELWKAWRR